YNSVGTIRTGDNSYPSQVVQGNATLNGSGTGLLIVTGTLSTLNNTSNTWRGIVLVGGELNLGNNAADSVWGMMILGLNHQIGTGLAGPRGLVGVNNHRLYV